MLVTSVTSNTKRIFKAANNLQKVRKRLRKRDLRKRSHSRFKERNHNRDLRKEITAGIHKKKLDTGFKKIITPGICCLDF